MLSDIALGDVVSFEVKSATEYVITRIEKR